MIYKVGWFFNVVFFIFIGRGVIEFVVAIELFLVVVFVFIAEFIGYVFNIKIFFYKNKLKLISI